MLSETRSVTLSVDAQQAFAFLANPENLPRWAIGFARSIRRDGDRWLVQTSHGDLPIRLRTDPDQGSIDFVMEPVPGVEAVAYSRVLPNGDGAEYVFTQFQTPGMSDEVFAGQRQALAEELTVLQALFRARAACDTGR